jgi:DNA polymerase-3 subunit gamma/tau
MVNYLRGMLFFKTGGAVPFDIPESMHGALRSQSDALEMAELIQGVKRYSAAVTESKGGWQPQLPLELAFIECVNERLGAGQKRPPPVVGKPPGLPPTTAARPSGKAGWSPSRSHRQLAEGPAPSLSEQPEAQQPVATPSAAGSLSGAQIQERWGEVRAVLKRRKHFSVEALLNSGRILGVEDQVVILGFEHSFHREKVGADSNRKAVEEALSEVMGTLLRVQCVDPKGYQPPPPPALDAGEIKRFAMEELDAQVIETGS